MSSLRLAWIKLIRDADGNIQDLKPASLTDGTALEFDMGQYRARVRKMIRANLGAQVKLFKHTFTIEECIEAADSALDSLESEMKELTVKLP